MVDIADAGRLHTGELASVANTSLFLRRILLFLRLEPTQLLTRENDALQNAVTKTTHDTGHREFYTEKYYQEEHDVKNHTRGI